MNPMSPIINRPIPVTLKIILNSSFVGFLVIFSTLLDLMKKDFRPDNEMSIGFSRKMRFINVIMVMVNLQILYQVRIPFHFFS